MLSAFSAVLFGLALLVWSADRFVAGAASTARHFGMPPLLIGMLVVGFGTSAPEMVVSVFAAIEGRPEIALGNAYGSNIANIALILGLTALINPITVHSRVLRKELPLLTAVSLLAWYQLADGELSRNDSVLLLGLFVCLMTWTLRQSMRQKRDTLDVEMERELAGHTMPLGKALVWLFVGLLLLLVSSRMLVWGAVEIAIGFGVSELIIGLTVVAVGTSLPELASSLVAARKGEHDIALGNVLGSNLFNTLVVVGLAGVIQPVVVDPEIVYRDMPVMVALTLSLFLIGYGFHRPGRISRTEGALLLVSFISYLSYLGINIYIR